MSSRDFFLVDVSIEVPPESKTGSKRLTEEEDNEYHQIQGREFICSACVCLCLLLLGVEEFFCIFNQQSPV